MVYMHVQNPYVQSQTVATSTGDASGSQRQVFENLYQFIFLLTSFVHQESITSFAQPPATIASDTSDTIPMEQVIFVCKLLITHTCYYRMWRVPILPLQDLLLPL